MKSSWYADIEERLLNLSKDVGLIDLVLVSGGARGVDSHAEHIARNLGIKCDIYQANWAEFGRSAGVRRTKQALQTDIDLCILYWDGKSVGTKFTLETAKELGIPVEVYQ